MKPRTSRTVGLPGMEIEEWLQPIGVFSLAIEVLFVGLTVMQKPWAGLFGKAV